MKEKIKEISPYVLIVVVIVVIRIFIATPVKVDGDSMYNTLNDNDIVLLSKLSSIDRFDIIVLKENDNNATIIKRVIGMPGDKVKIRNNKIYINNKIIEDEYAYGETSDYDEITLGDDEYFVLGDNRLISKDSRYFGAIKKSDIKGKAVFRLFPFTRFGSI
ncbi:signal peptidase IB [Clostridium sp. CAG:609]|nr:signal peptidase IB [Clostridium sp. CAG:609]